MGWNLPEQVRLQADAIGEQQSKWTHQGAAAEMDAIGELLKSGKRAEADAIGEQQFEAD